MESQGAVPRRKVGMIAPASEGWEGVSSAAMSRRPSPPAGSAMEVTLPRDVCAGSEAWKMTEDVPSGQKGSDVQADGELRPCRAQGSSPWPPSPERLCLRAAGPPLSLGLLLHGTPLPGPPAWPHVPYMGWGGPGVRPPGVERPMCAVPTNAFTFAYPRCSHTQVSPLPECEETSGMCLGP